MTKKKAPTRPVAAQPKSGRIVLDDVEVVLAAPAGKPKHRSAAAIRAAVRAYVAKSK